MSEYKAQSDRLQQRLFMASKLADQYHQTKVDSLEFELIFKILEVFNETNTLMSIELEKLKLSGKDKIIMTNDIKSHS